MLAQLLRSGKEELYTLLDHVNMEGLQAALNNPALDEHHLLALLKRKGLGADLLSVLCKHDGAVRSYQVNLAIAQHPDTPAHLALQLLSQLYLFDLVKLCSIPGTTPDIKLAAERTIIQRIPTQPLGTKLTLARRGSAAVIEALLKEGTPEIVAICLDNPRLKEGMVHQFINSGKSNAETISQIARHSRWQHLPNIRQAILKNPKTPLVWFTLWLPHLPQRVLKELSLSSRLTNQQRSFISELLGKRRS